MKNYITLEEKVEEILNLWREQTGKLESDIIDIRALYVDRETDIYTISFQCESTRWTVKSIPTPTGPKLMRV